MQLSSLLVTALYPNMYYLKKKRQVITLVGQIALIPKNSVNFDKRENASFPSPYFVFSEKVRQLFQHSIKLLVRSRPLVIHIALEFQFT